MLLDSKRFDHEPVHPSAGFTNSLPNVLMINLKKLKCYLKNKTKFLFGKLKCFLQTFKSSLDLFSVLWPH